MRLFIMRHGIARELGGAIHRDADRPLAPEGFERTGQIAERLTGLCGEIDWIASSPLLRARQTAEVVGARFGLKPDLLEDLQPGGDLRHLLSRLRHKNPGRALWVGHLPDVAELASFCLTGHAGVAGLEFKKDSIAAIHFPREAHAGQGILEWLIQPAQILSIPPPPPEA